MTALLWDQVGQRLYEAGVDHGVLYIPDVDGNYDEAHVWNGLVTVTESPSGAEANAQFADNIKYLNLLSAEQFGATIEAFTYPDAFALLDGSAIPSAGVFVGQQSRGIFGLVYRTHVGNDIDGVDHGHKLHLIYGAQASPSDKAYGTINDSPEAITFSWDVTTTPVPVTGMKPTASLVVDSTKVDPDLLADLEDILFGTVSDDARLPMPDEVIAVLTGTEVAVDLGVPANQPAYNSGTHVITLPTVTGVQWKINGVNKAPGAQPALTVGQTANVEATPTSGHNLVGSDDWTFDY